MSKLSNMFGNHNSGDDNKTANSDKAKKPIQPNTPKPIEFEAVKQKIIFALLTIFCFLLFVPIYNNSSLKKEAIPIEATVATIIVVDDSGSRCEVIYDYEKNTYSGELFLNNVKQGSNVTVYITEEDPATPFLLPSTGSVISSYICFILCVLADLYIAYCIYVTATSKSKVVK